MAGKKKYIRAHPKPDSRFTEHQLIAAFEKYRYLMQTDPIAFMRSMGPFFDKASGDQIAHCLNPYTKEIMEFVVKNRSLIKKFWADYSKFN